MLRSTEMFHIAQLKWAATALHVAVYMSCNQLRNLGKRFQLVNSFKNEHACSHIKACNNVYGPRWE